MAMMKGYWRHDGQRDLASRSDLRALIADVRALGVPTMTFLEDAAAGATFVFGVGRPETVLTFVTRDGTSFHSLGDARRTGVLEFWCNDQRDDFLAEMAIPEGQGLVAAEAFVLTRRRPTNVEWEADG